MTRTDDHLGQDTSWSPQPHPSHSGACPLSPVSYSPPSCCETRPSARPHQSPVPQERLSKGTGGHSPASRRPSWGSALALLEAISVGGLYHGPSRCVGNESALEGQLPPLAKLKNQEQKKNNYRRCEKEIMTENEKMCSGNIKKPNDEL